MAYGDLLMCSKCNELKSNTEFYKESRAARGYRYDCKACDASRFVKYRKENPDKLRLSSLRSRRKLHANFPPELFDARFEEQGKVCAICGSDKTGGRGEFHADHDHKTKQPRGVLCHNCNVALGNFQDNLEILAAAIEYLKKYSEDN